MKTFVLTGGIASGKSLASEYFAKLGIGIIDTDEIAKNLTTNYGLAISSLIDTFGNQIIDDCGNMKRELMREIIFNNLQEKLKLEQILYPLIKIQVLQKIQYMQAINNNLPYILLVIPLFLGESHNFWLRYTHASICLYSNYALRLQRIIHRGIELDLANKIINSQPSNEEYLQNCTYSIENNTSSLEFEQKIYTLHHLLLQNSI